MRRPPDYDDRCTNALIVAAIVGLLLLQGYTAWRSHNTYAAASAWGAIP